MSKTPPAGGGCSTPVPSASPLHRRLHVNRVEADTSNSPAAPSSVFCCHDGNQSSVTSSTAPMLPPSSTLTSKSGTELMVVSASSAIVDEIYDSEAVVVDRPSPTFDSISSTSSESRYVVPPDGGWGWVVVMASFCICFIVDSVAYSYPMIYTSLEESRDNTPEYLVFLIGATLMSLYQLTAPFASALVNVYGTRRVIVLGSLLTSAGLIISSRTTDDFYWLIFTFGIMGGVGLGMMYIGAMVSVGTYFDKRRPLALALAVCGSGLGMGLFPLIAHHLIDHFGIGPTFELYACFVLQGAWLGMLVWPLKPRPLYDCAKPRRKDLLDRVTEWVGHFRHREDSLDSLADPELVAERNALVKQAAKHRILTLRRFESGLATPPTTPGSSLSLATTATPHTSTPYLPGELDRHMAVRQAATLLLGGAPRKSFRRCTSIAVQRHGVDERTSQSCPQLSSLIWTPHASHALIAASDEPPDHQKHSAIMNVKRRWKNHRRKDKKIVEEDEMTAFVKPTTTTSGGSSRSTSGVVCEESSKSRRHRKNRRVDDVEDDDDFNKRNLQNRATAVTGATVSSSTSDFPILVAEKPVPLFSANCFMSVAKALEQSLDLSLLRDSRFWILALGNIAAMMGLYLIIFVLPALAAYSDLDDNQHIPSVIMAVFGGTHTLGRLLTGVMSGPRFRPLLLCNTAFLLSTAVFGVMAVAQEKLSFSLLIALAALHGLCYAFFAVLSTVIIVNVFGVRKLSSCFGMITLARGSAPYFTTLAYQFAVMVGQKLRTQPPSTDEGDVTNPNDADADAEFVQRAYGIVGMIFVLLALAFHLPLHFRYFKRRQLDVQRKPRTRLRCVSVPTPSTLSGCRLAASSQAAAVAAANACEDGKAGFVNDRIELQTEGGNNEGEVRGENSDINRDNNINNNNKSPNETQTSRLTSDKNRENNNNNDKSDEAS